MKKILSLLLVMVMAMMVFGGCAKDNKNVAEEKKAAEPATKSKDTSNEQVEITYYTWAQLNEYPENMIEAFEKENPNIKVNLEVASTNVEEYLQVQKVKMLSGEGLDVTTLRPETRKEYVDAGYLLDLSGKEFLKNYKQEYLDLVAVEGKIYSIPYALDVMGTIYNKTMFEKNGWKIPTNKKEWLELCDTISNAGITPTVNGYKDAWPIACDIAPFLHGVLVKDPDIFAKIDRGEAKYTDPIFQEAFKEIADYLSSNAVSKDAIGLSYDQAASYFATEKAAMMVHGEWGVGAIQNANPGFEMGTFPILYNKEGEDLIGSVSIGQSQAVTSFSKHPEAALKLVEFMSSQKGAQLFADVMANFTPVSGVTSEGMSLWTDVLTLPALDFYYNLQYSGANAEMYKVLQLMFINEITPEEALQQIQLVQDKKPTN